MRRSRNDGVRATATARLSSVVVVVYPIYGVIISTCRAAHPHSMANWSRYSVNHPAAYRILHMCSYDHSRMSPAVSHSD